ncbi:hypothetical protein LGV61_02470 [Desulfurispirillum indicum]|uniref:hypothetical protein n=1 Tax=Desulfurispirillum indicum TaxID=936456 RepID=UPI001CFB0D5B|nr:hypothetical protein [Desulfurispirillum indicum]UCZ57161.1 hypothetical protein LGV61_02470 [Desulfurispirillum indicum]
MKNTAKETTDELRDEYDFTALPRGERGKYAERYKAAVNIVRLDDDVFQLFQDEKSVNDALRSLVRIAQRAQHG